jgi:hypothetical protein
LDAKDTEVGGIREIGVGGGRERERERADVFDLFALGRDSFLPLAGVFFSHSWSTLNLSTDPLDPPLIYSDKTPQIPTDNLLSNSKLTNSGHAQPIKDSTLKLKFGIQFSKMVLS